MNFQGKQETTTVEKFKYDSVAKYMAKNLITFHPDQPIHEAIDIMLEKRISGAPVLNDKGDLIGVLSEKDCLRIIVDRHYHNHPNQKSSVGDYMSREVTTIDIDKDILDVANLFLNSNFRRFPVVEKGKLKGQISRRDVMRATRELKGTTW